MPDAENAQGIPYRSSSGMFLILLKRVDAPQGYHAFTKLTDESRLWFDDVCWQLAEAGCVNRSRPAEEIGNVPG